MPVIEVLVGLPASGKSTFAKEACVMDPDAFVYSTDNYIESVASAQGKTYNEAFEATIKEATENMNNFLTYALEDKLNVVWDQTNMSPKKRHGILSRFSKNYHKSCVCVVPPRNADEWNELNRRLRSREGKYIPGHVIKSMLVSYVEPELDEGFEYIKIVDIYGNLIAEKSVK